MDLEWHDCTVFVGDVRERLRELPDGSVQTCVTSPPYWGLRDYSKCGCSAQRYREGQGEGTGGDMNYRSGREPDPKCEKCGGTGTIKGVEDQIGLEPTPEEYVANLVGIFREVRRVLREDGTVWLNLGDSYARAGGWSDNSGLDGLPRGESGRPMSNIPTEGKSQKLAPNLKPKDLVGVPWRVAFALQDDGWWLRSDIIWAKGISGDTRMGSCMPESVTDRPTSAHEHVFLLSKSKQYFYDHEAVKEPLLSSDAEIESAAKSVRENHAYGEVAGRPLGEGYFAKPLSGGNLRNVWHVSPRPFPEAHFAVYPPDLIRPCILAGTSEKGACAECGAPWERVVESRREGEDDNKTETPLGLKERGHNQNSKTLHRDGSGVYAKTETTGWQPTCDHDADTVPCTVLDPFIGSGTTALVALRHNRRCIGIELNPDYLDLIRNRLESDSRTRTESAERWI